MGSLLGTQRSEQLLGKGRTVSRSRCTQCHLHHLVTDGWSDGVLLGGPVGLYAARVGGRQPRLPELTLTYADLARGSVLRGQCYGGRIVPYWMRRLAGLPSTVRWKRSGDVDTHQHDCGFVTGEVEGRRFNTLEAEARRLRTSPLALLVTLTARGVAGVVDGNPDLLVGSNTANHERRDKRDFVGYLTNTRLARVGSDPTVPVDEPVLDLRDQWLDGDEMREAYEDQVLAAMGRPPLVEVDSTELPLGLDAAQFTLAGVKVRTVTLPPSAVPTRHWRALSRTGFDRGSHSTEG